MYFIIVGSLISKQAHVCVFIGSIQVMWQKKAGKIIPILQIKKQSFQEANQRQRQISGLYPILVSYSLPTLPQVPEC